MGYSYTHKGALICDVCGNSGNVRKRICKYGYCKPAAICPNCWNNDKRVQEYKKHSGCKKPAEEFDKREQDRAALLAAGQYVRCSAMDKDEKGVQVLFRGNQGTRGFYMDKRVYNAFPLGQLTTPNDYRKQGILTEAPTDFYS